jgi:ABC-type ATPase with predicted acetyltransferase domain
MRLDLSASRATAVAPSPHVLAVASMFGLGIDQQHTLQIIPPITLDLRAGQVVFITGASGSGKSTLLRCVDEAIATRDDAVVLRFDQLPELPDVPLVDALGDLPLDAVTRCLSLAGLSDAFVMLRRPSELSDGQRYRLRLAQTIAAVEKGGSVLTVVLADEFGATLDRVTAKVIARNVRRWVTRMRAAGTPVCFIAATTHDDLLESLEPDVLIDKPLGEAIEVHTR